MRVLLDTHAYLWFLARDERLSPRGRDLITDPAFDLLFSVMSLWEVAIKHSIGKLPLSRSFPDTFPTVLGRDRVRALSIETHHLARLVECRSITGTRSTGSSSRRR